MKLYSTRWLRHIFLPLLKRFNLGDITIKHHWTKDPITLHSFKHREYWYHGKNRERPQMDLYSKLVSPGDIIIEAGGHVGYISLFFSHLVGKSGKVFVFEPAPNNLSYIKRNVSGVDNITLLEMGAGADNCQLKMFIEDLSGQNNSFIENFPGFQSSKSSSGIDSNYSEVQVKITSIDNVVKASQLTPAFIKIDVEGFELEVLKGSKTTLIEHHPVINIEVQRDYIEIYDLLSSYGYLWYDDKLTPITEFKNKGQTYYCFCFHRDSHNELLSTLKEK